jgi:quaternary ammonium compound-resistance protein SugE
MAWVYLVLAGIFEIGWPIGLKHGYGPDGLRWTWLCLAAFCIVISGGLLLLAQRDIPMGTAYAVWTGIGAAGTFLVGILAYGDPASVMRIASAGLILAGVVGLKLAH